MKKRASPPAVTPTADRLVELGQELREDAETDSIGCKENPGIIFRRFLVKRHALGGTRASSSYVQAYFLTTEVADGC